MSSKLELEFLHYKHNKSLREMKRKDYRADEDVTSHMDQADKLPQISLATAIPPKENCSSDDDDYKKEFYKKRFKVKSSKSEFDSSSKTVEKTKLSQATRAVIRRITDAQKKSTETKKFCSSLCSTKNETEEPIPKYIKNRNLMHDLPKTGKTQSNVEIKSVTTNSVVKNFSSLHALRKLSNTRQSTHNSVQASLYEKPIIGKNVCDDEVSRPVEFIQSAVPKGFVSDVRFSRNLAKSGVGAKIGVKSKTSNLAAFKAEENLLKEADNQSVTSNVNTCGSNIKIPRRFNKIFENSRNAIMLAKKHRYELAEMNDAISSIINAAGSTIDDFGYIKPNVFRKPSTKAHFMLQEMQQAIDFNTIQTPSMDLDFNDGKTCKATKSNIHEHRVGSIMADYGFKDKKNVFKNTEQIVPVDEYVTCDTTQDISTCDKKLSRFKSKKNARKELESWDHSYQCVSYVTGKQNRSATESNKANYTEQRDRAYRYEEKCVQEFIDELSEKEKNRLAVAEKPSISIFKRDNHEKHKIVGKHKEYYEENFFNTHQTKSECPIQVRAERQTLCQNYNNNRRHKTKSRRNTELFYVDEEVHDDIFDMHLKHLMGYGNNFYEDQRETKNYGVTENAASGGNECSDIKDVTCDSDSDDSTLCGSDYNDGEVTGDLDVEMDELLTKKNNNKSEKISAVGSESKNRQELYFGGNDNKNYKICNQGNTIVINNLYTTDKIVTDKCRKKVVNRLKKDDVDKTQNLGNNVLTGKINKSGQKVGIHEIHNSSFSTTINKMYKYDNRIGIHEVPNKNKNGVNKTHEWNNEILSGTTLKNNKVEIYKTKNFDNKVTIEKMNKRDSCAPIEKVVVNDNEVFESHDINYSYRNLKTVNKHINDKKVSVKDMSTRGHKTDKINVKDNKVGIHEMLNKDKKVWFNKTLISEKLQCSYNKFSSDEIDYDNIDVKDSKIICCGKKYDAPQNTKCEEHEVTVEESKNDDDLELHP